MPNRAWDMLKMRFGPNDGQHCWSLEKVGQHFKITRNRVRQIESRSLKKLRAVPYTEICRTDGSAPDLDHDGE